MSTSLRERLGHAPIVPLEGEPWSYLVASETTPGLRYRVDLERMASGPLTARCECPSAFHRPALECKHARAVLAAVELREELNMTAQPASTLTVVPKSGLDRLREPFPPEQICQLPKGGALLDYVGHADVTGRFLEVDPEWNWEPLAWDDAGLPLFDLASDGKPVGLWIRLTICGVPRLGYGSVAPAAFDAKKQLIGDALRNAGMRFGVALDLWSKADRSTGTPNGNGNGDGGDHGYQSAPAPRSAPKPAEPVADVGTDPEIVFKALLKAMPEHHIVKADVLRVLREFNAAAVAEHFDAHPESNLGTLIADISRAKGGN